MENGKRFAAEDGEMLLPEAIIQHIQSFLNGKEAAQTSILSKSWYSAWSTRPNLDFDQRDFPRRGDGDPEPDRFSEFARSTMQRYQQLNLKIESFRLLMLILGADTFFLARELIVNAMNLGATDLNLDFSIQIEQLVLPVEVLASENLTRLTAVGCTIVHGVIQKVRCSRLKYLNLCRVYIRSDVVSDIMSSCPLIETFSLSECECLVKVNRYTAGLTNDNRPSSFLIELGKQNAGMFIDRPINLNEFHKLKCLFLREVNIATLFFRDFSSKFPCLKDLTLRDCIGFKSLRISCPALECISIVHDGRLMAKLNVPSIQKFKFSGTCLPSLSFKTGSREWTSDIIVPCESATTSWLLKLRKVLTKLSRSKISLYIGLGVSSENSFDFAGDSLPRTDVENLNLWTIEPFSDCSACLEALFFSCRPKFITECWPCNPYTKQRADIVFVDALRKTLIQEVTEDCCIPNRNVSGLHDLEEVNAEFYEASAAEWQLLPPRTLSDASALSKIEQQIRFRLRWGLQLVTSN